MEANGFGRWRQKIAVRVSTKHRELVAQKLGVTVKIDPDDPSFATFEWARLTTNRRDDEGVVWDLSAAFAEFGDELEWEIDWASSEY
ncbi:hypothetical protein GOA66_21455 [Sinorhizobium meliloti]|nr:hypothetical protein [Sinorhizobium meliloti]